MGETMLFGECLGKVVHLSAHDVAEIMEHQAATRRRFGEIALAWGLCRPQHVWKAWWHQLAQQTRRVDLATVGVDSQAVSHFPPDLAIQFRAVPLRCYRDQLVVAVCERALPRAQAELPRLLNKQIQFVIADGRELDDAIALYYHPTPAAPPTSVGA